MKLRDVERIHILKTFAELGENRTQTAKHLGIGLRTLQRKLRSYGVAPGRMKQGNWEQNKEVGK